MTQASGQLADVLVIGAGMAGLTAVALQPETRARLERIQDERCLAVMAVLAGWAAAAAVLASASRAGSDPRRRSG